MSFELIETYQSVPSSMRSQELPSGIDPLRVSGSATIGHKSQQFFCVFFLNP